MNRIKVRYEDIVSVENLIIADQLIRESGKYNYLVKNWDEDWYNNIYRLHVDLVNFGYKHSGYKIFYRTGSDGKRRKIHMYLNYRDRIVQKAAVIVLKDFLAKRFVGNTYSSIPGRGVHKAIHKIKKVVREKQYYCLQLDIKHFFEEISQSYLLSVLKRTFKDARITWLFGQMVSAVDKGIVLGAEDSQWLANLCLSELDHLILEQCKPNHYFRYCDDLVLFDESKEKLQGVSDSIEQYLNSIGLVVKPSKRVFLIADRRRAKGTAGVGAGLDFLGYVFYRHHTDLRKRTKERWRKQLARLNEIPGDYPASVKDVQTAGAITGLLKHCDSSNLLTTWQNEYKNYFKRLRNRRAAKDAAAKQRKKELAALLQQTKHAGAEAW